MAVALLALFIALGGPAQAAHLISGSSIKANSITNKQIRNGTLGTQDLSKKAYTTLRTTPAGSVGTTQLRENAVTGKAIAAKAVDASKLVDGAVGNTQLAGKSVDASKLADGAVGPTQLATGAVTSSKVADGSIGAAAIADGTLQTSDLGDFYGTVTVDFAPFAANTCQEATVSNLQPAGGPAAKNTIADDVVSISPSAGWPDPIVLNANPGAGNTIRIIACRVGGNPADETDEIDPPQTVFRYVAFDTP
jgi:hypothetical protein